MRERVQPKKVITHSEFFCVLFFCSLIFAVVSQEGQIILQSTILKSHPQRLSLWFNVISLRSAIYANDFFFYFMPQCLFLMNDTGGKGDGENLTRVTKGNWVQKCKFRYDVLSEGPPN